MVEYRTNYDTSEAYFIIVDPVLCPYLVVAFTWKKKSSDSKYIKLYTLSNIKLYSKKV